MKNFRLALALAGVLLLSMVPAIAQQGSYAKNSPVWLQQGKIAAGISVTNSSSPTVLPTAGFAAWICNTGSVDAYLAFGTANTIVATAAGGSWLKAGTCGNYDLYFGSIKFTYVAAITASSTTTLAVETGQGSGPAQLGGGGGGGAVTQGTIPWVVSGQGTTANAGTDGVPVQDGKAVVGTPLTGTGNLFLIADTSGYSSISVQITSPGSATTITYEGSEDGSTWFVVSGSTPGSTTGGCQTSSSTATLLNFPVIAKQFRARVSAFGGGTINGQGTLRKDLVPVKCIQAAITGAVTVNGNVGGYDFQLSPTITVQNAVYPGGSSLGGLITVTGAARTNGGAGSLNGLKLRSAGGSTNTIWVYAWSKTPASTCTDKVTFVASATDNPYSLVGFPTSVVLGNAPGAWDTATNAQITALIANFKNQDTSPGTPIYLCLVTANPVTPPTTTDMSMVASGMQD